MENLRIYKANKQANVKNICLGKCRKYMERPPEHIFPASLLLRIISYIKNDAQILISPMTPMNGFNKKNGVTVQDPTSRLDCLWF